MLYLYLKDKRRRVLYDAYEKKLKIMYSLLRNLKLSKSFRGYIYRQILNFPRDASITRLRNRCVLTNRPRAVYRTFGMSRLMFRKYAWQGKLIGVKKASW